jgi:CHAT domain-containing protein
MAGLEERLSAYEQSASVDSTVVSEADLAAVADELAAAEAAWSAFRHEMAERHPAREGRALSLHEIQGEIDALTALIGWLDVERFDGTTESWAYVVRDRGTVGWVRLGDSMSSVADQHAFQRRVRDALADPTSSVMGVKRDANVLWRARFSPVYEMLAGVRRLVVVPSGPILGVPVESLVLDDGRYVSEVFEVSYAPSATVFAKLRDGALAHKAQERSLYLGDPPFADDHAAEMGVEFGSPWELLAMAGDPGTEVSVLRSAAAGDPAAISNLPRLAGTRAEIALLSELSDDADVLLGLEASEQELVSLAASGSLKEYGTIHLATHALVDDEHPENSALVLSQVDLPDRLTAAMSGERLYDGLLTAKEIVSEWRLDADLVTLSACETGLGLEVVGEGYVGFAHAFIQAGARSLVVSLWKVDDRATALLMRRFYQNCSGAPEDDEAAQGTGVMTKAEALAEAKDWLRNYEEESGLHPFEHPYYWSGFVLIGATS